MDADYEKLILNYDIWDLHSDGSDMEQILNLNCPQFYASTSLSQIIS